MAGVVFQKTYNGISLLFQKKEEACDALHPWKLDISSTWHFFPVADTANTLGSSMLYSPNNRLLAF